MALNCGSSTFQYSFNNRIEVTMILTFMLSHSILGFDHNITMFTLVSWVILHVL